MHVRARVRRAYGWGTGDPFFLFIYFLLRLDGSRFSLPM